VTIELTDFNTKKVVDTLEVDACLVATGRAPYTNGGGCWGAARVGPRAGRSGSRAPRARLAEWRKGRGGLGHGS
jgi:hypothetical protein